MSNLFNSPQKYVVKAHIREFTIPPVRDGLVLGRESPIGCVAMRRALELLIAAPFEYIEIEDDIVKDILVRQTLLRRVPADKLVDFVLRRIKPLMSSDEILYLELNAEILIEDEL
ncbi:MAG: hypothetical protein ACU837_16970 [Gammaproteobacteria bacterium]